MKLQSIQALRGLAASLVVIYHIRALELKSFAENGLSEAAWVGGVFTNGYAGVDLFFVISGFIMVYVTHQSERGRVAAADFLFARVTRIYPVWWAFAAMMVAYMVMMHGTSGENSGWAKATGGQPLVPYLAKSFLLQPQPTLPVLNVGWTLVHEMYFYLVFTLMMLLPRPFLPWALGVWALLVFAGTVLGLIQPVATGWLSLAVHPMTMEFILGAFAGLMVTGGFLRYSSTCTLLATAWLLASLSSQTMDVPSTLMWGRVIWFGLPCTLLVYGVAGLDLQGRQIWLLPAAAGILVTITLYQMTGLDDHSPPAARLGATMVALTLGILAMLGVIWSGWLSGQRAPHLLHRVRPRLRALLGAAVKLGDWSFALYLCHLIVLSLVRNGFGYLAGVDALSPVFQLGHPGRLDNIAYVLVGLPLTIAVSAAAYILYERPLTRRFGQMRRALFAPQQEPGAAN